MAKGNLITFKSKPRGWRTGQTIFNFLQWLRFVKGVPAPIIDTNQERLADTFHLPDEELDEYWKEFLLDVVNHD